MTNNMVNVSNAESGTKCLKMTNPNMDSLKRPWCLLWTLLGWSLGGRKCLDATGHEIWHGTTAPHLINMQIYVKCQIKRSHAGVCNLIRESRIEIHLPGSISDIRLPVPFQRP